MGQRALARAVGAHHRVHLAGADLQVDARQDLPAGHLGVQPLDHQPARAHPGRSVGHDHVVAVAVHLGTPGPAGWRAATAAARRPTRRRCRASSIRSSAPRRRSRPRPARSRRGCSGRRWRRSRRRCAPGTPRRDRRRGAPPSPTRPCPLGSEPSSAITRPSPPALVRLQGVRRVELAGQQRSQPAGERRQRQLLQDLVEEAEGDQPVGHLGRHPPALQVEALVLGDRADGRGVAAAHVVVLDLQVGHRVGVGALVQHQVAVGLHGVGAPRPLLDPDQAAVDRAGRVGHRPL